MDLITKIRPVDRLVSAFNAGFALLWLSVAGHVSFAPELVVAHGAAALLPLLVRRLPREAGGVTRALRELYPLLMVVFVWTEMGLVREFLHGAAHDPAVAGADLWLFGRHVQRVWMPAMPQVWFSELMFGIYCVYYPMVFATPAVLLLLGRRDAARRIVFGLTAGYLACYLLYAVFPVDGPSHTMVRYAGSLTDGFFYRLSVHAVHAGDSLGTAFPSSHVVGAVSMAILAARWLPRPAATVFAIEGLGVTLATVYTQNHFAIDSAAGVLLALLVQLLLVPAVDATRARRRLEMPVPPLPIYVTQEPERARR
jgi:membrane-associated phospholipid phosphatase